MTLDGVRDVLLRLVCGLVGLTCVWSDQRRPYVPPDTGAIALLALDVAGAIGVDERRTTFDAGQPQGEEFRDTINGTRRATLTVRVEAFDQTRTALAYLETLRTRLASQDSLAALDAANVALWSTAQVVALNAPADDHVASIGALDVVLGLMINEGDAASPVTIVDGVATPGTEAPVRYGYIQTVEITDADNGATFTVEGPA